MRVLSVFSIPLIALLLPFASTAALAGGGHKGGHADYEFGTPGNPDEIDRTIQVSLEDVYFEPETIDVKAGETIRFVLTNTGELVHEFNIGTPHMHAEHQDEMQMMVDHGVLEADKVNFDMMKMEMADGITMEHDDPNSVLLEPKGRAEIIWTFAKPMELEFACNIPGHYDAGMAGTFAFVEKLAQK
jgi:uncharacterized cupredoxin-like copper-binding protein